MFIPYRAKIKITRIPWAALAITVVCLLVYWAQERNEERIVESARRFCTEQIAGDIERAQKRYIRSDAPCWWVLAHTYLGTDPEGHLKWHVEVIEAVGDAAAAEALVRHYRAFAAQAPAYLTAGLWQRSGGWNPLRMLTAAISHGSWDHVIGNLFFFLAFAMVVETIIGPVLLAFVFLAMGLSIGALENMLTLTREGGAGLGLSGVVMGMMTLAAWFAPRVKIKYFYFFFLYIGVLSVPLWAVAAWYVGWNIVDYLTLRDWSYVNYAAHLAGAAVGLAFGATLFRNKRHWVAEQLVADERALTDEDEPWLTRLNAIAAVPVVMFFGFIAFLVALYLLIKFIETFAVQLLIAAPAVAAGAQLYRLRRGERPDYARYREALERLERGEYGAALSGLGALAGRGHQKAMLALAGYYSGKAAPRNDAEAFRWYERAAARGNSEAQYVLGTWYMDGRHVGKDPRRAVALYESAANRGNPDAAQSLGYHYEHGVGIVADRERAIEYYYRAAAGYKKLGRRTDLDAMIRHLESTAARYPAVLGMLSRLKDK
ncbi:MAG: hypothetical protein A3B81_06650 [Candidatus Muproteobacteria bacterium RIFCSPHIGHO2_02_FULL_65_16]|uniref:Peptidase S54 rhomboid domain-containing protein n=1 Tax=Candidatus Muproteobacteria bacterium RIFCSPHIGHO2_02_FULL_65_16 TaxID=1817766 RepID=A0A1F6U2S6_9PROT|nr:MAG: hypothetical protein A3B81_06650 [Candidatus Muproteobacteria bacterium RIFCSPHIGHO2_02_FULL_65_16]